MIKYIKSLFKQKEYFNTWLINYSVKMSVPHSAHHREYEASTTVTVPAGENPHDFAQRKIFEGLDTINLNYQVVITGMSKIQRYMDGEGDVIG